MRNQPFDSFEVTAPGRVNLIGEHTDYNDGCVLPMAIDRAIRVRVTRRPDRSAVITSERAGIVSRAELDLASQLAPAGRGWAEYAAGVIAGYQTLGFAIQGFDAAITTDLPAGGGLSSSAALEMAVATVVETLCGRSLPTSDKALLCQRAEHTFAGVSVRWQQPACAYRRFATQAGNSLSRPPRRCQMSANGGPGM